MANNPFKPLGKTIKVAGAASPPTGVQAPVASPNTAHGTFRLFNRGTVTATVGWGASAADAATNSVIPTDATTNAQYSLGLPAGAIEVLVLPPDSYFSALAAVACAVEITPGRGY